jgi:hypothetical protein
VLLDDREQVGQQLALDRREVGRYVGGETVRMVGAIHRPVAGDGHGVAVRPARDGRLRARIVLLRSQAACRVVSLVRYRCPSSSL